jgi:Ca-activated chloride channel family protein
MSRHALHITRRRRRPLRILLATVLTLVVATAVMIKLDQTPESLRTLVAKAPLVGAECPSTRLPVTTVSLTIAPELESTVSDALAPLTNQTLPDHECVKVSIEAQEPSATVQGAAILPVDRAPDIWIPDSSLWVSRVPWKLNRDGAFATSPVVVATSQAAIDQLGWARSNPSWLGALAGNRPLAVPRIAEDAAGLSAVIALWQSLGKGENAQKALAGTVLAAGRAGVPTEQQAIEAAESGAPSAPLLPTSEQAVTEENSASTQAKLVFVRPSGGTPTLDYPVLTTIRPATLAGAADTNKPLPSPAARERAIRAVVAQLFSSRSAELAEGAGFEIPESRAAVSPVPSTPSSSADPTPAASPSGSPVEGLAPLELAALVERITLLAAPSRQLVIFDLSGSMAAPAGNGQTRIQFAATAASLAGNLLTDSAQAGLWGFSRDLDGKKDIVKILDVAPLGSKHGASTQRVAINQEMAAAAHRLGGNGTALYSVAVAGMEEMRRLYDPRAGNAVVIFTDGTNHDPGGPSLKATVAKLAQLYDPDRPVRLICIGIGSGADLTELKALSSEAGGEAYLAKDPKQLPGVLFAAMNKRK